MPQVTSIYFQPLTHFTGITVIHMRKGMLIFTLFLNSLNTAPWNTAQQVGNWGFPPCPAKHWWDQVLCPSNHNGLRNHLVSRGCSPHMSGCLPGCRVGRDGKTPNTGTWCLPCIHFIRESLIFSDIRKPHWVPCKKKLIGVRTKEVKPRTLTRTSMFTALWFRVAQNVKTAQLSTNGWMDKHSAVHPHSGISVTT